MKKEFSSGKYCFSVLIVILLMLSLSGCVNLVKSGGGSTGAIEIPVNLNGANGVGSLHIELVYDSSILEVTSVKTGKIAQNAVLDFNISAPGRVIIGIVSPNGINGSGAVAGVVIKAKAKSGSSSLKLEQVEAYSAEKLQDMKTQLSDGQFNAANRNLTAPAITFSP